MATLPPILETVRSETERTARAPEDLPPPVDPDRLAGLSLAAAHLVDDVAPVLYKVAGDGTVALGERTRLELGRQRLAEFYRNLLCTPAEGDLAARREELLDAVECAVRAVEAALAGERAETLEWAEATYHRLEAGRSGLPSHPSTAVEEVRDAALRVYDRTTGRSRYDPIEDTYLTWSLACPRESCRQIRRYRLDPEHSTHRVVCEVCGQPFTVHTAFVVDWTQEHFPLRIQHQVRLCDFDGTQRTVRFAEPGPNTRLDLARRHLLVVTYDEDGRLRAARDYTARSREVVVPAVTRCFVCTAATHPFAPEVQALRYWRDRYLAPHRLGRLLLAAYAALGPRAAAWVAACPKRRLWARRFTRLLARLLAPEAYRAALAPPRSASAPAAASAAPPGRRSR